MKMEAFFEEVSFQELQLGVKYKIKSMPHHYTYYTGIFKGRNGILEVFDHVMYHGPFGSYKDNDNQFVHQFYYVLVPQKEKIQQAMEKRALHLILRRVVDDHFIWE
jgi:hypothetical protein